MANQTKKRSFFERLTGSIRMEDDESVVMTPPPKRAGFYRSYDEDYETDDEVEASVEIETESIEEDEELADAQLAVDVYETNDAIVVKTMTAGVKKEELQITASRELLTIRGRREQAHAYQNTYHIQELYWGSFSRTIELPDEIDIELASATEHHGLVTITLPKFDKKKQATLKIQ